MKKSLKPQDVVRRKLQGFHLRRTWGDIIVKVLFLIAGVFILFQVFYGVTIIADERMSPSLRQGDLSLYDRLDKSLNFTDVVSYIDDGKTQYGRVMGLPGDVIDINEEGQFMVNGQPQARNNEAIIILDRGSAAYPVTVPEGSVFILNDQYENTDDSRNNGPVTEDRILGHLLMIMRRRSF